MEYTLKRILPSGIDAALGKADKYRGLNQPSEAESICRDVLAIDAGHQLALRILGLALTDQFATGNAAHFTEAEQVFARLDDAYERSYYTALAFERQAKAQLAAGVPLYAVRPLFDHALVKYADAEAVRPPGNDDPILRWNSCVRALQAVPGLTTAVRESPAEAESEYVNLPR